MNTEEQLGNIRFENGFNTIAITFEKGQLQKESQQGGKVSRGIANIYINIF